MFLSVQIFDWHIGWTLYRLGFTSIISLENYGWWIECACFFGLRFVQLAV